MMSRPSRDVAKRQRIVTLVLEGCSLSDAAREIGISRERVRQLIIGTEVEGVFAAERMIKQEEMSRASGSELVGLGSDESRGLANLRCPTCDHRWSVPRRSPYRAFPADGCRKARSAARHEAAASERIGQRFAFWTIVAPSESKEHWVCRCDCGDEYPVSKSNLYSGRSKSCKLCGARRRETLRGITWTRPVRKEKEPAPTSSSPQRNPCQPPKSYKKLAEENAMLRVALQATGMKLMEVS